MTAPAIPVDLAPPRPARSFLDETLVVFRWELRSFLVSPRTVLPMTVYAGFGALIMFLLSAIADKTREQVGVLLDKAGGANPIDVEDGLVKSLGPVMEWTGWGNSGDLAEMLRDHVPLVVVGFFALASYFLPLLVALVSFDQFSDLSTRGARFSLLRVRRDTFFAGKAAAAAVSVAAFLLVMWLAVLAVAITRGGAPEPMLALKEGGRAWAFMCVLALPYLGITAFVSSLLRPALAFAGTMVGFMALSLGATVTGLVVTRFVSLEAAAVVLNIFPWSHAPSLVSRYAPTVAWSLGGLVVIAAVVYAAALTVVRRRDV